MTAQGAQICLSSRRAGSLWEWRWALGAAGLPHRNSSEPHCGARSAPAARCNVWGRWPSPVGTALASGAVKTVGKHTAGNKRAS